MKVSLFDFQLPPERIAQHPVSPRDASRLMVVSSQDIADKTTRDLPALLRAGDIMVFNDTRVIPARLEGKRGEAAIEVTLHKFLGENRWSAFARPGKRLRVDDEIHFAPGFSAVVKSKMPGGEIELQWTSKDWQEMLEKHGKMPLPPYIKKSEQNIDKQQYQTIYSTKDGAVAAPTAGLHFTDELLAELDKRGILRVYVTLHVGGGTFLPVKSEDTLDHKMHSEYAEISRETSDAINAARHKGGRVVAVGTTALRVLESSANETGNVEAFAGPTDIFITPGYRFKAVDILLTNFHLPRSTLFMLVSAFMGLERMHQAYHHAIGAKYRFYSYGDACLLVK